MRIVGLSGSLSRASRTTSLVEDMVCRLAIQLGPAQTRLVEVAALAPALAGTLHPRDALPALYNAFAALRTADVLVVGTPVQKGSYTGLLKHFLDLLDPDDLAGKVVVLAATGAAGDQLPVIDHQLRPLFSYFGTHTVPTGLFARDGDFQLGGDGGFELTAAGPRAQADRIAEEVARLTRGALSGAVAVA
ncbi:NAD(P)H-dependent oxidoreductase [Niveispirillum sp. KHB5.9]|uniref:NAD(P)H-dependent oxidoreductase n=1 Tax=Niveispirillum sp. KHB5.9 TaxID=3400269 RepID=UPI003A87C648